MPEFEGERWIQQPNRWLRPASLALLAVGLALSVVTGVLGKAPGVGAPLIVFGAMGASTGRGLTLWPSRRLARVRADARGLHVDGALLVPREAIARAYVQPLASGYRHVRVEAKTGPLAIDVVVNDGPEGARILEALELDAAHSAVAFRGSSPFTATPARQVLAATALLGVFMLLGAFAGARGPAVVAALPLLALPLVAVLLPPAITVGADGVLTRWLGFERFYSYEQIDAVTAYENGISLRLKSGRSVSLATSPARSRTTRRALMNRDALVERIEEALRAFASHRTGNAAALVARGGRPVAAWIEALRALAASADYREAAVPREALWRIVEDPGAAPTARAGAAVALRARIDPEDRARLRVAAESSVSPRVRVALHAAATVDDEGEMTAALEHLGDGAED